MWTFGEGAGPGRSPGSKSFFLGGGHKNSQKCIVGIYFISFTAKNNALHMLGKNGDFWHLGGMAPLASPKSAYVHPQKVVSSALRCLSRFDSV